MLCEIQVFPWRIAFLSATCSKRQCIINNFAILIVRNFSSAQQFLSYPLTTFFPRQMFLTLIPFATLQSHLAAHRHHNKIKTVTFLETCLASRNTRRCHETRSRVVVAYVFVLVRLIRAETNRLQAHR